MKMIDTDKDDMVSFQEYKNYYNKIVQEAEIEKQKTQKVDDSKIIKSEDIIGEMGMGTDEIPIEAAEEIEFS